MHQDLVHWWFRRWRSARTVPLWSTRGHQRAHHGIQSAGAHSDQHARAVRTNSGFSSQGRGVRAHYTCAGWRSWTYHHDQRLWWWIDWSPPDGYEVRHHHLSFSQMQPGHAGLGWGVSWRRLNSPEGGWGARWKISKS